MDKNTVFFGTKGLTATSANFVANLAKEYVDRILTELDNIKFLDMDIEIIGSYKRNHVQSGVTSLDSVADKLKSIADAHALIAWLREGIKAKDAMASELENLNYETWTGHKLIEAPELPKYLTRDDVLAEMSADERNRMYALKSAAAVYGKFVHPGEAFSDAKKELADKLVNPIHYVPNGANTIIKYYTPSLSAEEVDNMFFELQAKYRECQAQYNKIEHGISSRLLADKAAKDAEYSKAVTAYNVKINEDLCALEEYRNKRANEINDLKIIIPASLEAMYQTVQQLGKHQNEKSINS